VIPGTVLEFGDRGLSVVDRPDSRGGQSSELKAIWASLAAVLAVVLLVIAGIVFVVHRRRASRATRTQIESDAEFPVEMVNSLGDLGNFLSEENALSQDRTSLIVERTETETSEHSYEDGWNE
jgi:hypothetical protein